LVAHAYNPSYLGGRDQEDHSSKTAQFARPYPEKLNTKQGWWRPQVAVCLTSMHEALSSNPIPPKKKKECRSQGPVDAFLTDRWQPCSLKEI
jgi:hypothetical protein